MSRVQPFYRQMFGFKKGDFPVTELAGRTSTRGDRRS
jgi:hypothetical protein